MVQRTQIKMPQSPNVIILPVKMIPDNANDTANESVKLFRWCFSRVKRQHVS